MYHGKVNVNLIKGNIIQIDGRTTINVDLSVKSTKYMEKSRIWNPSTCVYENEKYLANIMDDSVIT